MLITYLFDPLCGWCYGASPALDKLAQIPDVVIELAPTGLFSGTGARQMDQAFADFAWSNDQRIARLTGQIFSNAYRDKVLEAHGSMFDSGPATLALTAVHMTQPNHEREALKAIQKARYVDGRDITALPILSETLARSGFSAAATAIILPSEALIAANRTRTQKAHSDFRSVGASGVPTLIIQRDERRYAVSSSALFGGLDALISDLSTTSIV